MNKKANVRRNLQSSLFVDSAGFSLVELLLYSGLFIILLIVLLSLFNSLISIQLESESTSSISQDGQYILAKLSYDIARADSISLPATPGASSSAMTLVIASMSAAYTNVSGNLLLGTDKLNSYATTVSNFSAKRLTDDTNEDSLTVSFVLTSTVLQTSGTKTESFTTTINRRSQ